MKTEEIKGKKGHKLKESQKINYNIYLVSSLTFGGVIGKLKNLD